MRLTDATDRERIDTGGLATGNLPRQGRLGDCWVMAPLLAVALADRRAPDRMVCAADDTDGEADADGTSARALVRVPLTAPDGQRILVERRYPTDAAGRWLHATTASGEPGWAAAVEAALAREYAGSYRMLARGLGRLGLPLLTGLPTRMTLGRPSARRLEEWCRAGHAVVVSTHPLSPWVGTRSGVRLPPNHVFAVEGADPATGRVRLRNPWDPGRTVVLERREFVWGVISCDRTLRPVRDARPGA
ncbi:crotonobetainyl-CoA--carnitine CoA-transferase [Brachybacterium sp. EF45031]|uniref:C2 family cysteine protease n=1 Tax=Brachybacterium sillae TaxID=2810536 RepID=UPI00217DDC5A|nr:C2 family cysteine protease [Brachybacterium sillae]MCS6710945.1 crotonobetainyl-CoA--carnitine CoA-transferase [Brachybacterium sillae]